MCRPTKEEILMNCLVMKSQYITMLNSPATMLLSNIFGFSSTLGKRDGGLHLSGNTNNLKKISGWGVFISKTLV